MVDVLTNFKWALGSRSIRFHYRKRLLCIWLEVLFAVFWAAGFSLALLTPVALSKGAVLILVLFVVGTPPRADFVVIMSTVPLTVLPHCSPLCRSTVEIAVAFPC